MERATMTPKQIVVIGASSGGIEALRVLAAALPEQFPAAVCVVTHVGPESPGVLPDILSRAGKNAAIAPRSGDRLRSGRIYVAPPDQHLLIEPGRVRLTRGPKENRFRPAIDPLFRSAAQVYGPAAIGVILTGNLDDGVGGLWAIKQLGGTAIVQDPHDALFPSMPRNAIHHVRVDFTVPITEIAPLLVRLTAGPVQAVPDPAAPEQVEVEVNIAKEQNPLDAGLGRIAHPSSFACPECHGVLLQIVEGGGIRFRCHTGHAYSVESLLAAVTEGIEDSMWIAIRALQEGRLLMQQMYEHLKTHDARDVHRLAERAEDARRQSEVIRKLVMEREPVAPAEP